MEEDSCIEGVENYLAQERALRKAFEVWARLVGGVLGGAGSIPGPDLAIPGQAVAYVYAIECMKEVQCMGAEAISGGILALAFHAGQLFERLCREHELDPETLQGGGGA